MKTSSVAIVLLLVLSVTFAHAANDTNTTVNNNPTAARIYVKEFYPKDNDFVFVCDVPNRTSDHYTWYYGDDQKLLDIVNGDTYHRFKAVGTFTVSCSDADGNPGGSVTVTVSNVVYHDSDVAPVPPRENVTSPRISIKAWYPKDNDFVFVCDVPNPTSDRFNWYYGDGHKLLNIVNGDTYHRFKNPGNYTVSCSDANGNPGGSLTVPVSTITYYDQGTAANTIYTPIPAPVATNVTTISPTETNTSNSSGNTSVVIGNTTNETVVNETETNVTTTNETDNSTNMTG